MGHSTVTTLLALFSAFAASAGAGGCATIRTTDTPRTATEQFLVSAAAIEAVGQLAVEPLRGYNLFVDTTYLIGPTGQGADDNLLLVGAASEDKLFLVGEVRNRLLVAGARLTEDRATADVIVELRTGALGVDRLEYLLGIPAVGGSNTTTDAGGYDIPVVIPELAIYKNLRQRGYASVGLVARWRETGELVTSTGPAVGRTRRQDYWFFGIGPTTRGDIPTTDQDRRE